MEKTAERRREDRIRFSWPAWFGYEENGEFAQGQIVDLSRHGVCFSVPAQNCPDIGDHVITRFSYPLNGSYEFQMGTYYQWAQVVRTETTPLGQIRVALKLAHPLDQDPSQTEETEYLMQTA